jgi:hypothetical protein
METEKKQDKHVNAYIWIIWKGLVFVKGNFYKFAN